MFDYTFQEIASKMMICCLMRGGRSVILSLPDETTSGYTGRVTPASNVSLKERKKERKKKVTLKQFRQPRTNKTPPLVQSAVLPIVCTYLQKKDKRQRKKKTKV